MIDDINCYDMGVFLAFQKVIHEPGTLEVIRDGRSVLELEKYYMNLKGE